MCFQQSSWNPHWPAGLASRPVSICRNFSGFNQVPSWEREWLTIWKKIPRRLSPSHQAFINSIVCVKSFHLFFLNKPILVKVQQTEDLLCAERKQWLVWLLLFQGGGCCLALHQTLELSQLHHHTTLLLSQKARDLWQEKHKEEWLSCKCGKSIHTPLLKWRVSHWFKWIRRSLFSVLGWSVRLNRLLELTSENCHWSGLFEVAWSVYANWYN